MDAGDKIHRTAGVDVGSSAVKVALVRSRAGDQGEILGKAQQRIRRRRVREVVDACFAEACAAAGLAPDAFDYVASTGDGEAVRFRTGHFYSITTHARGALLLLPEARGVVDIGALHARAIRMDARGKVLAQRMTSQCASGSGQFLENIGRYLGVPLQDIGGLSRSSESPERVSSICAVLAETDVINMVSRGIGTSDILKGIHLSIAGRLLGLLRAIRVEGMVVLTGGLSHDEGLVGALGDLMRSEDRRAKALAGLRVETHPDAVYAGALGAALLGAFRYRQLELLGRLEVAQATARPAAP